MYLGNLQFITENFLSIFLYQLVNANHMYVKKIKLTLPKYGTFFVLAQLAARIFPSVPRIPKPPGTSIPLLTEEKK